MELSAHQFDQIRAKQLEDEAVRRRFGVESDDKQRIARVARMAIQEVNLEFNHDKGLRNRPRA